MTAQVIRSGSRLIRIREQDVGCKVRGVSVKDHGGLARGVDGDAVGGAAGVKRGSGGGGGIPRLPRARPGDGSPGRSAATDW